MFKLKGYKKKSFIVGQNNKWRDWTLAFVGSLGKPNYNNMAGVKGPTTGLALWPF